MPACAEDGVMFALFVRRIVVTLGTAGDPLNSESTLLFTVLQYVATSDVLNDRKVDEGCMHTPSQPYWEY